MAPQKIASFAVEDMKEGTGLFDDVNARIVAGRFTKEAPSDNYQAEGNPIFAVVEFLLDGDAPEEERRVNQSYSLGAQAGDNFTVSDDGDFLICVSDDAAARKDSKWGTFSSALQNEGVSKAIMGAFQFSKITGLYGHFKRIADKERSFSEERKARQGGKSKFPPSTLVCTKILAMPGEQPAAGKSTTSKPASTAAPQTGTTAPAASGGDLDGDAWTYLEAALKTRNPLQRGGITLAVTKAINAMGGNENRQAIARRAAEETFISSLVEAGLVTYGASEKGQPVTLVTA